MSPDRALLHVLAGPKSSSTVTIRRFDVSRYVIVTIGELARFTGTVAGGEEASVACQV